VGERYSNANPEEFVRCDDALVRIWGYWYCGEEKVSSSALGTGAPVEHRVTDATTATPGRETNTPQRSEKDTAVVVM
jgi:hypothetical protein